jgi:excinuclease ABC subunit A
VGGKTLVEVSAMTVEEALSFFEALKLDGESAAIAEEVLKEVRARLGFLSKVGLG